MTAEIAVMNQEAVALAADSAVSGPKIFTSANKIFALSKYHPVAVMVYDSAQFMHVPWETIVKTYRTTLGTRTFPTLREHAAHFLGFFDRPNPLFPESAQREGNGFLFWQFFRAILAAIDRELEERTVDGEELTEDQISEIAATVIESAHDAWTNAEDMPSLPPDHADAVRHEYANEIETSIEAAFEQLPLSDESKQRLREVAAAVVSKSPANPISPFHSGIVIAGFGVDEYFPSLYEFGVETIALNRLKYDESSPAVIGANNRAVVRAFAQSEQVATFMEGIDTNVTEATVDYWKERLPAVIAEVADHLGIAGRDKRKLVGAMSSNCETAVEDFSESLDDLRQDAYVSPIIRVVAMMPKDELAAMAESLVNLTSFKRKVTEEAETVGGPIDVAVISKGDGLIWIKRKHYFEPELNQQFFANYYREDQ